jgi:chromosome segregation ATPase
MKFKNKAWITGGCIIAACMTLGLQASFADDVKSGDAFFEELTQDSGTLQDLRVRLEQARREVSESQNRSRSLNADLEVARSQGSLFREQAIRLRDSLRITELERDEAYRNAREWDEMAELYIIARKIMKAKEAQDAAQRWRARGAQLASRVEGIKRDIMQLEVSITEVTQRLGSINQAIEAEKQRLKSAQQNVAHLTDRVMLSDREQNGKAPEQRFGTQGRTQDGCWIPWTIQDVAELDSLRADYGLEPFSEYFRRMNELYGSPSCQWP